MKSSFWQDKSVFLTGHTGFKGSWLSLWLRLMGAKLTGYAQAPPTSPSLFDVAGVSNGMTSVEGDIRDLAQLQRAMQAAKPEIVIHMAAQALVRESFADPVGTYGANVLGTVNLLESVRRTKGIKAVVVVTSDKCYKNYEWLWSYREQSPLGGDDPYSSSKACAELVVHSFRQSFFNPTRFDEHRVAVASARAGNVIGGGDWARDRLVPDAMRALLSGSVISIRNPRFTRPWQHVLDPLNGYLTLAEGLYKDGARCAGSWNFGPYDFDEKTVGCIAERLHALWGKPFEWERDEKPSPHEYATLKLDSSKARALLGWGPKLDLPTTLRWIVEWYKAYQAKGDMRGITEGQIRAFMKRSALAPSGDSSPSPDRHATAPLPENVGTCTAEAILD